MSVSEWGEIKFLSKPLLQHASNSSLLLGNAANEQYKRDSNGYDLEGMKELKA